MRKKNHTYILDTNVLLDDPTAISSFEDNDIIIPLIVLEEMDRFKDKPGEVGANAREFNRYISKFIDVETNSENVTTEYMNNNLNVGVTTDSGGTLRVCTITELQEFVSDFETKYPELSDYRGGDNKILHILYGLTKKAIHNQEEPPILVSRDIQLRTKCNVFGLMSQDRKKGGLAKRARDLYRGIETVSSAELAAAPTIPVNDFAVTKIDGHDILVRATRNGWKPVNLPAIQKFTPKNIEQKAALDLLLDPEIKLVTIIGRSGSGKAQALDSKILTPTGWTTMGNVKVGDMVVDHNGKPTMVTGVFPQGVKEMFRVTFSDGSSTKCCIDHLWHTQTIRERAAGKPGDIRDLRTIRDTLKYGSSQKRNHMIPMVSPVEFTQREVPVEPYFLGVLLGDGSFRSRTPRLSTSDPEILELCQEGMKMTKVAPKHLRGCDYQLSKTEKDSPVNLLTGAARRLDLWDKFSYEKHVPDEYKYNSTNIRVSVLQGLMDTDGFVSKSGMSVVFYSASQQLAKDVQEIVWSLGGKATICNKQTFFTDSSGGKKNGRPSYSVHISLDSSIEPFRLQRKKCRLVPRTKYPPRRWIDSIDSIGFEEAQCISVENKEHLYVTDDYIVTHNTLTALAAGLEQVLDRKTYRTLFVCRPIQPVGRDIGYLPGGSREKLDPWLAPVRDNLKFLLSSDTNSRRRTSRENMSAAAAAQQQSAYGDRPSDQYDYLIDRGIIEIEALTYLRGRSIANAFMFIDECFPYKQKIITDKGKMKIGKLVELFNEGKELPLIKTYNESTSNFEYKKMTNGWNRGVRGCIKIMASKQAITVTENHKFLTLHGWKMASELIPGKDVLLSTKSKGRQYLTVLSEEQNQLMIGSYLGDGSIQSFGGGKYRMNIVHGIKQKEYCAWKKEMFVGNNELRHIEKNGFAQTEAVTFSSTNFLSKYEMGKKTDIDDAVIDAIGPKALAIWFMDDGSVKTKGRPGEIAYNGANIWTCSFSSEANKKLSKMLIDKFGIQNRVQEVNKAHPYRKIVLNAAGYRTLSKIIAPYIHDSMDYKIHPEDRIQDSYKKTWSGSNSFLSYGAAPVSSIEYKQSEHEVFDIEVEDNHNFLITSTSFKTAGLDAEENGIIAHNCQNITEHELKTILTRAGENTKIVLTGDVEQIDALHLDSVSNGLAVAVQKFRDIDIAGHVTMVQGVRSKLATISSEILGN